jgi:uncharacterized protein YndB with AHSA1/START domain
MPKTNLHQQILIDALPSKVWKVLTHPDYVSQYLFEGSIHCNWTDGSPVTLAVETHGRVETFHKGNVVHAVPGVLLKYQVQDENGVGFVTITYELIPAEDGIELKIYCADFNDSDEEYLLRLQQTRLLLQKIKWLAEYA